MAHIYTLLAHAGGDIDQSSGALIPPIELATTYERHPDGSYPLGFKYARDGNPTRRRLESAMSKLEGGSDCRAFSSGMAASNAIFQAFSPGDHVLIPDDVYHGIRHLVFGHFGLRGPVATAVNMSDTKVVESAFRDNTRMIWIESPSNPILKITDIKMISEIARARGAMVVVDATWTTPLLQQSFDLGADLVMHSLTKYMAGHSDVLGGAVLTREGSDVFDRICTYQQQAGAVLDPFSSWLTIRGLRTLGVRLSHQCASAQEIASFLENHNRVRIVHYPGLEAHPEHAVAKSQMSGFGAMISFEVEGGEREAMQVAARVRVFTRATSLGATESLIEHRASMEGPQTQTPANLLRLSIGLEHSVDLIEDLDHALDGR